jgi:hypothetical protein
MRNTPRGEKSGSKSASGKGRMEARKTRTLERRKGAAPGDGPPVHATVYGPPIILSGTITSKYF